VPDSYGEKENGKKQKSMLPIKKKNIFSFFNAGDWKFPE